MPTAHEHFERLITPRYFVRCLLVGSFQSATLMLAAGLACAPSAARAQVADEIVAANIAATGGEEAIARIENVTSSGSVTIESSLFGTLLGSFEAVRVPGRGYFETVELGPISQQKGWDGQRAWEQSPNGLRRLEGDEAAALVMQSFPNVFVALRQLAPAGLRLERLDDVEVNGRPHYALAIESGSAPRSTVYVDRETNLLSRSTATTIVPNLGEAEQVMDVVDYEAVEGVMMATALTITVEGISTTRLVLDSTAANTTVNESIFVMPGASGLPDGAGVSAPEAAAAADPFVTPYQELCGVCHGENLGGAAHGTPLAGVDLKYGDSVDALERSIAEGFPQTGMPGWSETLDADAIRRLALYIAEQRASLTYTDFKVAAPPVIPDDVIASEGHTFRIETVAEGIDPWPYSIAPLPDGRMLVTEKTRGLRILSPDGELSAPIRGTPEVFDDGFQVPGILLVYGLGHLLDVAPHPDHAENGWIYLSYTERCNDCNTASRETGRPVSMVALIRGRIEDGEWVDEETIWRTDIEHYTGMPDMAAGGRIAFDGDGHVFLSIGIKGGSEYAGVQDLGLPYGKIHRVRDDGAISEDNPFAGEPSALATIWTYGHRSPQGLEFDRRTGRLWGTEMGPRGGDEVNLLRPGRNYGWPLYSKGMNYDGTPVAYGTDLRIDFDLDDIEQPVVDLTPAPAVSSFVLYDADAFPKWRGNLLVSTLKATELYRMVVEGERVVHTEVLLEGLGRIRDVETGPDGFVYLLLEHASGSRILRLVPAG
jgi:glucose/arabinose dehydrogenase